MNLLQVRVWCVIVILVFGGLLVFGSLSWWFASLAALIGALAATGILALSFAEDA